MHAAEMALMPEGAAGRQMCALLPPFQTQRHNVRSKESIVQSCLVLTCDLGMDAACG